MMGHSAVKPAKLMLEEKTCEKDTAAAVEIAEPSEEERKPGGRKREGRRHPRKIFDTRPSFLLQMRISC